MIIALPLAVIVLAYLLDIPESGQKAFIRIGICCLIASVAIISLFVIDRGETLIQILRLDEGLGYRENENLFVKEIMQRAPWYNQFIRLWLRWKCISGERISRSGSTGKLEQRIHVFQTAYKGQYFIINWYTCIVLKQESWEWL